MTEQEFFDSLNITGYENEHLEFKEAKASYSVLGEQNKRNCIYAYSVALGNEKGGKLILGVDNNKHVVGTRACENIEIVKQSIYEKLGLRIEVDIVFVDNKRVLVINIPSRPSGKILKFYGIPLMRVGEELRDMDEQTERNILNEIEEDWSSKIVQNAKLDVISEEAIVIAKENFVKKFPNLNKEEIYAWPLKTFLAKAKLLNNGKLTNAALILLGKEEVKNLLRPYVAEISWILKNDVGDVLDYKHFSPPFILTIDEVFKKIRNLKYRYIKTSGSLFPEETDQYDSYVIREALNNCIAHQDYSKCARITVVEKPDSLVFTNEGSFIPETIKAVIDTDMPPRYYRNKFLADAMVNLNMIDTVGSGIKRMFSEQRKRLFPLPSYDLSDNKVKVEIFGKIIDVNYARLLAKNTNLSLDDIILLDNVQKKKTIEIEAAKRLRKLGYIEGRYPNIYISAMVAEKTGAIGEYLDKKGLDNQYYEKLIMDYLKIKPTSKRELDVYLGAKLSNILTDKQKKKKVSNLLYRMALRGLVESSSRSRNAIWSLKR